MNDFEFYPAEDGRRASESYRAGQRYVALCEVPGHLQVADECTILGVDDGTSGGADDTMIATDKGVFTISELGSRLSMIATSGAKSSFTYAIVTDESAEQGETAETGWYLPGLGRWPLRDTEGDHPEVLAEAKSGVYNFSIREGIEAARKMGGWTSAGEGTGAYYLESFDSDPEDGAYMVTRFQMEGITGSTFARICRLLGVEPEQQDQHEQGEIACP